MTTPSLSLRTRLFAGIGGVVVLLVIAQLWWVRSLTQELGAEVDTVALQVGNSVAQFFSVSSSMTTEPPCDGCEPSQSVDIGIDRRGVQIVKHGAKAENIWVFPEGADSEARGVSEVHVVIPDGAPHSTIRAEVIEKTLELGPGQLTMHLQDQGDATVLRLERPDLRAEVPISRTGIRNRVDRFQERLWIGSGLILVLGLFGAALISHRISSPLAKLADAAEKVGGGDFGTRVDDAGGGPEIRRTLGAFNDMSARLESLDARNRQLEGLRQLEEIGDIARGLAHSLRNPLNALGLSVEQLATAEPPRRSRLVETAGRQVRRLDAGIRSFLVLASPGEEAGVENVVLQELVRDVVLEVLQDAGGRVGLELDLDPGPISLPAVVAELRAVVQALVVNAAEASPDGGRVHIRLRSSGDGATLEIDDRGPGLPPEVRRRLFTPHVSTKPNGSGMGLFLAHRIAGFRYGGRLQLLDRENGGTTARLDLGPRRPLDAEDPAR